VPRGGRPTWANAGSDPHGHSGARRRNTPRFSCERITLRGVARDRRPQRWLVARSRATNRPVRAESERGSAPPRDARMTAGCAVRVEEGIRPVERLREPSLGSGRSGHACLLRKHVVRGSSARAVPERGRPKAKAGKGRHLSRPHTRNRCARGKCPCIARIAEVGRTSRAQMKRATGRERVESPLAPRSA